MNPGYPQMGQMPMQPMGGPMMGGPMGASPMMQRPIRRGTSRAVPVVVSAGLAVGVFCGLLFGLGTGKDEEASAAPAKGTNVKESKDEPAPPPSGTASVAKPASTTGTAPTKATGSAAVAAAGSAAGSAAATVATIKTAKLTVQVKPDGAASAAKIQVDGKDITGTSIDIPVDSTGKKTVKVSITAPGFHSADKKVDIMGDETTLEIEMVKRGGGGGGTAGVVTPTGGNTSGGTTGTGATSPGKGNTGTGKGSGTGKGKGKGSGGGGLIDI
jgi:hypothetical protein